MHASGQFSLSFHSVLNEIRLGIKFAYRFLEVAPYKWRSGHVAKLPAMQYAFKKSDGN